MEWLNSLVVMTLAGGIMIGVSLGALTMLTGRVMSGSSMIGSLLGGAEGVAATSIAFIGGIIAAPLIVVGFGFAQLDVVEPDWPLLTLGGLCVGIAARWGGASLGGVITGIARRTPLAITMLLVMLLGTTVGGVLQGLFSAGGGV